MQHTIHQENKGWILKVETETLPPQLGTTAHAPEVAKDITSLIKRNIYGLRVCKVGDIVKEHGKGGGEGGLSC